MADETRNNREISDDQTLENEEYQRGIDEFLGHVNELSGDLAQMKERVGKPESKNNTFGTNAPRAEEIKAAVSEFHMGLASALGGFQDSRAELKRFLGEMKGKKDVALGAMAEEKEILVAKIANLENSGESEVKGAEILALKKRLEVVEALLSVSPMLIKLTMGLATTFDKVMDEMAVFGQSLADDATLIAKQKNKSLIDDLKQKNLAVIGVGILASALLWGLRFTSVLQRNIRLVSGMRLET